MSLIRYAIPLCLLITISSAGCGPDDAVEPDAPVCDFLPGSLVITEILSNPAGDDAGSEWFEIYNTGTAPVDLTGLRLQTYAADGLPDDEHIVIEPVEIGASSYMVMSGTVDEFVPDWAGYGYGSDLTFRNSCSGCVDGAGELALICGDTVIDAATWPKSAGQGVSSGIDGAFPPDALANDVADIWCTSTTPFDDLITGSPGGPNESCFVTPPPPEGTCTDPDGTSRPFNRPVPGDIALVEVAMNPGTPEPAGEWFELTSSHACDWNGLTIVSGTSSFVIADESCLVSEAGTHQVFARDLDQFSDAIPYGTVGLSNSGDDLSIWSDEVLIDEYTWTGSSNGVSHQKDFMGTWCDSPDEYAPGEFGTPGTENASCLTDPPPGDCLETECKSSDEICRVPLRPDPGTVSVTEWMANPVGSDAVGEWFEVVGFVGDLNGIVIGDASTNIQEIPVTGPCLEVGSGTVTVFARSTDPAVNGGLPAGTMQLDLALNQGGDIIEIRWDGIVAAHVEYTGSSEGVAEQVDALGTVCVSDQPYGDVPGNFGTPGLLNPDCPAPAAWSW